MKTTEKPKLSELIPKAEAYLANRGYGSGTNYSTLQVAGMMAMFALECGMEKYTLPSVSISLVDTKFMKWLAKEAPELSESLYNAIHDYKNQYQ
jgi:hypothetical protein